MGLDRIGVGVDRIGGGGRYYYANQLKPGSQYDARARYATRWLSQE